MPYDNFINIPFSKDNLDRVVIRNGIINAIKSSIGLFKGELLDIGCGKMPYKNYMLANAAINNYVGLDIETAIEYDAAVKPDFTWDGKMMPFENQQYETVFATEVLEHCPRPEIVLKEVHRVLKTGGVFFFTVPFLWPLHEVPHDAYRYTPYTMQRLLDEAGFVNINITASGAWNASMAQMLGLWVRRSPMGPNKRKLLSFIIKPMMKYLLKKDNYFTKDFYEGQMITGLYGTAIKP